MWLISAVRTFDMIVMKFQDEIIIMGIGLIIQGDIFIIYYMLNGLAFKVYRSRPTIFFNSIFTVVAT